MTFCYSVCGKCCAVTDMRLKNLFCRDCYLIILNMKKSAIKNHRILVEVLGADYLIISKMEILIWKIRTSWTTENVRRWIFGNIARWKLLPNTSKVVYINWSRSFDRQKIKNMKILRLNFDNVFLLSNNARTHVTKDVKLTSAIFMTYQSTAFGTMRWPDCTNSLYIENEKKNIFF